MASTGKMKSCKKLERSSRQKARNQSMRPHHVKVARQRHIKNALRSNGAEFANALKARYAANPTPLKKHSPRRY